MKFSDRKLLARNIEKLWERGMIVEDFKFDSETERKMDRFKEFFFSNLIEEVEIITRRIEHEERY